ncbi:enamine deaminase RidA (YjgF/YER057c/UK114 family) [Bradyrhizobium diazoefficiens]
MDLLRRSARRSRTSSRSWPKAAQGRIIWVRLTWYVVDMDEYVSNLKALGKAYREVIGTHSPSMALVQVVRLVEPSARVEIEATAVVPR